MSGSNSGCTIVASGRSTGAATAKGKSSKTKPGVNAGSLRPAGLDGDDPLNGVVEDVDAVRRGEEHPVREHRAGAQEERRRLALGVEVEAEEADVGMPLAVGDAVVDGAGGCAEDQRGEQ